MSIRQILLEIVERIRKTNLDNAENPIPSSDMIHRKLCADIEPNQERMQTFLKLLSEAHYIFIVKIVEPDPRLRIDGIYGYVAAEVQILAKLREVAARKLEGAYAAQMYQRKQASVIVKELLPQARNYNNTPIGNFLNVSVMLQQYEHFLATSFAEFTETWKKGKLSELLLKLDPSTLPEAEPDENPAAAELAQATHAEADAAAPLRAVDHAEIARIEEMDRTGRWGDAVDKFGVQFLLRIHFRKYEFEKVRSLIRQKKIAKEEDLKFVRDTVQKMESRVAIDPNLERHQTALVELRRAAQMRISQIFNAKKQL